MLVFAGGAKYAPRHLQLWQKYWSDYLANHDYTSEENFAGPTSICEPDFAKKFHKCEVVSSTTCGKVKTLLNENL